MQHSLSTNFFHFFATTRLLQYCNSQGLTDQNRLVPDRGSRGSLVTVMGWQSRDFFKCLPPLFKSCTSATILPVSQKESTDQIDRLSGPWISIPEDSSPLIKYPNKQKIYSLYFSRCPVFHQKTGNLHLSTWRRPWVHWPSNCIGIMRRTRAEISQNWVVEDITMDWFSIESFRILWSKEVIHPELDEEEAQFMAKHFMTR